MPLIGRERVEVLPSGGHESACIRDGQRGERERERAQKSEKGGERDRVRERKTERPRRSVKLKESVRERLNGRC